MGYDFSQGEKYFRWSSSNWLRVIEMASRHADGKDFSKLHEQEQTLTQQQVQDLFVALSLAITKLEMPDMEIKAVLEKFFEETELIQQESNVWGFSFPWPGQPVLIPESDARWQGLFFEHLVEFAYYLNDCSKNPAGIEIG